MSCNTIHISYNTILYSIKKEKQLAIKYYLLKGQVVGFSLYKLHPQNKSHYDNFFIHLCHIFIFSDHINLKGVFVWARIKWPDRPTDKSRNLRI